MCRSRRRVIRCCRWHRSCRLLAVCSNLCCCCNSCWCRSRRRRCRNCRWHRNCKAGCIGRSRWCSRRCIRRWCSRSRRGVAGCSMGRSNCLPLNMCRRHCRCCRGRGWEVVRRRRLQSRLHCHQNLPRCRQSLHCRFQNHLRCRQSLRHCRPTRCRCFHRSCRTGWQPVPRWVRWGWFGR